MSRRANAVERSEKGIWHTVARMYYFIQKFDQDWNEWVDVTDASSLVNRDKLKLIKANREVTEVSFCLSEN